MFKYLFILYKSYMMKHVGVSLAISFFSFIVPFISVNQIEALGVLFQTLAKFGQMVIVFFGVVTAFWGFVGYIRKERQN